MGRRKNKSAPAAAATAPGHGKGAGTPMQFTPYLAEQVECPGCGWDDEGTLVRTPAEPGDEDYAVADDVSASACDGCGMQLAADVVVLRDRHGRCAQAVADEISDDRSARGRALIAALHSDDIPTAAALLVA